MKILHTRIEGVESNAHNVTIKVRRAGTDSADEPNQIEIIPAEDGLLIRVLRLGEYVVDHKSISAGQIAVRIPFKKEF